MEFRALLQLASGLLLLSSYFFYWVSNDDYTLNPYKMINLTQITDGRMETLILFRFLIVFIMISSINIYNGLNNSYNAYLNVIFSVIVVIYLIAIPQFFYTRSDLNGWHLGLGYYLALLSFTISMSSVLVSLRTIRKTRSTMNTDIYLDDC